MFFERDSYTCQKCQARSGNGRTFYLQAHHIKSFAQFPDLRYQIDNGITLCKKCHQEIESKRMLGNQNGKR